MRAACFCLRSAPPPATDVLCMNMPNLGVRMDRALVASVATERVDTGLETLFSTSASGEKVEQESETVDVFGIRHLRRGLGGANPIVETVSPDVGRLALDVAGGRGKGRS